MKEEKQKKKQEELDKQELHAYIMKLFRMDYVDARIQKQIKKYIEELKKIKEIESSYDLDIERWNKILDLKNNICKDTKIEKSIMTKLRDALKDGKLDKASKLLIELEKAMEDIKEQYKIYERNII